MKTKAAIIAFAIAMGELMFVGAAQSQTNGQLFFGGSVTAPSKGNVASTSLIGGAALVTPIFHSSRFFVRPFVAGAIVEPANDKPSFRSLQVGAQIGFKVTPIFAVVVGKSESFLFPHGSSMKGLPTWNFGAAATIDKHWRLFVPVSTNSKGKSAGVQLGFVF